MTTYNVTVNEDGTFWRINGKYHREDGPAIEWANGSKLWYQNGKLHRIGAPAVVNSIGSKHWWREGVRHREDGPACEFANGLVEWCLNGKYLTETEFNERMNPAKEMTVAELEAALGHKIKVVK